MSKTSTPSGRGRLSSVGSLDASLFPIYEDPGPGIKNLNAFLGSPQIGKRHGEISLLIHFNPNLQENKSYYMNFILII